MTKAETPRDKSNAVLTRVPVHVLASGGLTPHEQRVFVLVANGLTTKEIARKNSCTTGRIYRVLGEVYDKLGACNAPHAVSLAYRKGILGPARGQLG